jgi:hypothetical protein
MMVKGVMKPRRRQHPMAAALSNTRHLIICLRRLHVFKINPNIVRIVMAIIETIQRMHGDEEWFSRKLIALVENCILYLKQLSKGEVDDVSTTVKHLRTLINFVGARPHLNFCLCWCPAPRYNWVNSSAGGHGPK